MKVTFVHPDLGIGGAERLVVDAATAMRMNGHRVVIVTNSYSTSHCFEESKNFEIKSVDVFPRTIFNRCAALCAYIRMCIAALYVAFAVETDLVFCDSISACIIIFRAKIIYYCHFPDLLLTDRETFVKTVYRSFIDRIEEWSTGMADLICVNSKFTEEVAQATFKSLTKKLYVLYPTLNTQFFDDCQPTEIDGIPESAKYIFVSINRFEKKKRVGLAIEAFGILIKKVPEEVYRNCFLVIAGGYDKNNEENLLHFSELREHAVDLKIPSKQILFLKSPSDEVKVQLLRQALTVLYTPSREHFGIVPVEAMYMKCCVIAVNSGGPKESVDDGVTGFLVEPNAEEFAKKMAMLIGGERDAKRMGEAGYRRVIDMFSMTKFRDSLEKIVEIVFKD
ncbi:unnamed protein product [Enterobius vermicularis]|uniref:Alpha-1,3/1,6-mannosyltransferase ALG2 n=1 Tax=Enterobius vermicularis TaxID=51028 RepID=A0A0N4VM31_ENTVE|nr:unnamed protein product [Enterobius vermicularis]